jgi:hypothetical protein
MQMELAKTHVQRWTFILLVLQLHILFVIKALICIAISTVHSLQMAVVK